MKIMNDPELLALFFSWLFNRTGSLTTINTTKEQNTLRKYYKIKNLTVDI